MPSFHFPNTQRRSSELGDLVVTGQYLSNTFPRATASIHHHKSSPTVAVNSQLQQDTHNHPNWIEWVFNVTTIGLLPFSSHRQPSVESVTGHWFVVCGPHLFPFTPFQLPWLHIFSRPAMLRYMKASVVDLQPSSSSFGLPLGPVSCILPVAVTGIWSLLVNSPSQAIYKYCNSTSAMRLARGNID